MDNLDFENALRLFAFRFLFLLLVGDINQCIRLSHDEDQEQINDKPEESRLSVPFR